MAPVIYAIRLPFDVLYVSADLVEASAPIAYWSGHDKPPSLDIPDPVEGEWITTPFQTAAVQHDKQRMALLVLDYMGAEYWLDPASWAIMFDHSGRLDKAKAAAHMTKLIQSVEAVT